MEEVQWKLQPAAMRVLVDALDEATLRTQILLTTHSAELLDNPTIRPENVRVVEMIDGKTVIGPVDEAGGGKIAREPGTPRGRGRAKHPQATPSALGHPHPPRPTTNRHAQR